MKKTNFEKTVFAALGAALIAVCAWITVPGPVPFTMQSFAIFFLLFLLGGKPGTVSVLIYILLGAAGVPVFSGFKGGIGVLLGPTGGYIAGFILSALLYWLITGLSVDPKKPGITAALAGLAVCYLCGTVWFVFVTSKANPAMNFTAALSLCVLPFVPFDILKIFLAKLLAARISKAVNWQE